MDNPGDPPLPDKEGWYVFDGDEIKGPRSISEIKASVECGMFSPYAMIAKQGDLEWQPVEKRLKELAELERIPADKANPLEPKQWYISDGEETRGPYTTQEVRIAYFCSKVSPHAFVMRGEKSSAFWAGVPIRMKISEWETIMNTEKSPKAILQSPDDSLALIAGLAALIGAVAAIVILFVYDIAPNGSGIVNLSRISDRQLLVELCLGVMLVGFLLMILNTLLKIQKQLERKDTKK